MTEQLFFSEFPPSAATPRTIKHEEYTYKGRRVILDACELSPGRYETMLLSSTSGHEYAVASTASEAEALAAFDRIRADHKPDKECEPDKPKAPTPLTGKYAQLRDDLRKALAAGRAAEEADPEDGGACNFDSAALYLPRWNTAKVEQAAEEAGTSCFKWSLCGRTYFVFRPNTHSQGNARSRNAEAVTAALRDTGYNAVDYYQMD